MNLFAQLSNAARPQTPNLADFSLKQLEAMQKALNRFVVEDPQFADFKEEVAELEVQIMTARIIVKHRETTLMN